MMKSRYFRKTRLEKLLLTHLVERALEGDYAALEERAIARAVFGRGASFDPGTDGVVEVVARRLRKRLAAFYSTRKRRNAPFRIELPKGEFVPVFVWQAPSGRRNTARWAVLAAVLALMAGGFWLVRRADRIRHSYNSVAVLPFRNMNQWPDLDHYSVELTAHLREGLRKTAGLRLGPAPAAQGVSIARGDIPKLARALSVDAVVNGSVLVRDKTVKIRVQLLDGRSGQILWSDVYDNRTAQIPAVENDILYALKRALKKK